MDSKNNGKKGVVTSIFETAKQGFNRFKRTGAGIYEASSRESNKEESSNIKVDVFITKKEEFKKAMDRLYDLMIKKVEGFYERDSYKKRNGEIAKRVYINRKDVEDIKKYYDKMLEIETKANNADYLNGTYLDSEESITSAIKETRDKIEKIYRNVEASYMLDSDPSAIIKRRAEARSKGAKTEKMTDEEKRNRELRAKQINIDVR